MVTENLQNLFVPDQTYRFQPKGKSWTAIRFMNRSLLVLSARAQWPASGKKGSR